MSKLDQILQLLDTVNQRLDTVDETVSGLGQQVQNLGRTAKGEVAALRVDLTTVFTFLHEYEAYKKKLPH